VLLEYYYAYTLLIHKRNGYLCTLISQSQKFII